MSKPALTKEQLESVKHLSSKAAGEVLGYSKTAITESRQRLGMKREAPVAAIAPPSGASFGRTVKIEEQESSLIVETIDSVPQTKDHIDERMRARGFDPEKYTFTYGFSEWEAQTPDGIRAMYSARASATERRGGAPKMSIDELLGAIQGFERITGEKSGTLPEGKDVFVFCFADPQLGKTDINGGTVETLERFYASLDHACALLEENPAALIVWADLGDGIENFCNTTSQRQTNDLNLVEQVRMLRRIQMDGLLRLSKYAPIVHVSVPSNHSQNRVTFQGPASTAHDDWGMEVSIQLEEAFTLAAESGTPYNVTFVRPEPHMESVSLDTTQGVLGFVHGHRSNSQNGLETWWAGQALGEQPTAKAKLLFVGHFHNLSVRSVGAQKYIITAPALDNGSSWFTVSRGNVATAGVLTMRVRDGVPMNLEIV